ncbi:hypothetical protein KY315_02970 [Candidatus Woesearchaeota archaeon]|nr:hypothetical protein [Candidatus Woesearchaeota archaeon]
MPNIGLIPWVVDILATRYGWTKQYILEGLYWEEMWEQIEVASNLSAYENNQKRHFNFLLHAGSKEAVKNWKDSPLPFPDKNIKRKKPHYGGLDQLPAHIQVKRVGFKKLKNKKDGKQNRHSNTSS